MMLPPMPDQFSESNSNKTSGLSVIEAWPFSGLSLGCSPVLQHVVVISFIPHISPLQVWPEATYL